MAKIPEAVIVDNMKSIQPIEVLAVNSLLNSRFIQLRHTNVPFEEWAIFIQNLEKVIKSRKKGCKDTHFLIDGHLLPMLDKLIAAIPPKSE